MLRIIAAWSVTNCYTINGCPHARGSLFFYAKSALSTAASPILQDAVRSHPTLRPYQEECIDVCLEEYKKGIRRQAVSLPVGSGKTVVFANLITRLPNPTPQARKVLVLAHREELLAQAERQIQRVAPHLKVSIEKGTSRSNYKDDDVIIASVPTLGRRSSGENRLERFDPKDFKAIIIDEAHHSVAESYLRIMNYFGVKVATADAAEENPPVNNCTTMTNENILVWGCSATFSRNDELALGDLFEKVVYHRDMSFMMSEGWLSRAETYEVSTKIDLDNVKIRQGDLDPRELSLAIDTPTRNDLVAATWIEIAQMKHQRKATIIFALNVQHARNLAQSFARLGISTELITGTTDETSRADILQNFSKGTVPVLINCAVLTEGTDLPIADCIIMTRPTCNANLYIQMAGRGLRKHPNKEYCLIIDFVDKHRYSRRSLITFPSLLAAKEKRQTADDDGEQQQEREGRAFPDLNAADVKLEIKKSTGRTLVAIPKMGIAWIGLDECNFAVTSRDATYLLELHEGNLAMARLLTLEFAPSSYGAKTYTICDCSEVEPIHDLLSKFAARLRKDEQEYKNCRSNAFWRKIRPISDGQRRFLYTILSKVPGIDSERTSQMFTWSMGRASDLISKYYLRNRFLNKPIESFDDFLDGVESY